MTIVNIFSFNHYAIFKLKRKLHIIPNEDSYSLHLHCENDDEENEPYHICVKRVIYIRNYKSFACCYFNGNLHISTYINIINIFFL